MIKEYNFNIVVPPDKTKKFVYKLLINYQVSLDNLLALEDIKYAKDVRL